MTKTTKLLPAAALALLTSTAMASAQPADMKTICENGYDFCAYDEGNNLLGKHPIEGILEREIGSHWYFAGYDGDGLTTDVTIFWPSPDCNARGTDKFAYIQSGYISADGSSVVQDPEPLWAQWSGNDFFAATKGTAQMLVMQSNVCFGPPCNGNPQGVCMHYSTTIAPFYPTFAPVTSPVESPKFVKPSTSCAANQSCLTVK